MSRALLVVIAWLALTAHVGTTQVVFEGQAGGYPVRVVISPPGVVPAQVPILVRVLDGTPTRVTVRAAQWNVGTRGAPPAEDASPVAAERGAWAHDLWIMTASTYAIHVGVEGSAGRGSVVVPLQTSATRTLAMQRAMGIGLAAVGVLLVAGLLSIVGAAAREGALEPGVRQVRGARLPVSIAAAVVAIAIVGGAKWWSSEEAAYRRTLLRPLRIESLVASRDRTLEITVTDSLWRTNRLPPLMPDHGKLMHLFLADLSRPDSLAFAHLHPARTDADRFRVAVPSLPAGRYLLFGDLLFQSGATRTLVDTIDIDGAHPPAQTDTTARDGDDSWRNMRVVPLGAAAPLESGATVRLEIEESGGTIAVGRDMRLVATVRDAAGQPVTLDTYMGMRGHAMVLRDDGRVFVHLHPAGTASATAGAQLRRRERGDTAILDSASIRAAIAAEEGHEGHVAMAGADGAGRVAFPFAFPSAGSYRVVVQIKERGRVESAVFRIDVAERGESGAAR